MRKSEILTILRSQSEDQSLGFAIGRYSFDNVKYGIMTFNEFLQWYNEGTGRIYKIITEINEEGEEVYKLDLYLVNKYFDNYGTFKTEEEAEEELYNKLRMRYSDDNGAGGIWLGLNDLIDEIEAGEYDDQFEPETEEETI